MTRDEIEFISKDFAGKEMDMVEKFGLLFMKVLLKCAFGLEIWNEKVDYIENGRLTKKSI